MPVTRIEVSGTPTRTAFVELPARFAPLPEPVIGAVAFLLQGLEGTDEPAAARTIAKMIAHELAAGAETESIRVHLTDRNEMVTNAAATVGLELPHETSVFGEVDIIDEHDDVGVYLLRIAPGGFIPTHEHRRMDEWEYAFSGELSLQSQPIPNGEAVRWPTHFPHRWENRGKLEAVVLCIDRPRFDAGDEIVVEPSHLAPCPIRFRPFPLRSDP